MPDNVQRALSLFTTRYVEYWQQHKGHEPESEELFGIASPCIVKTRENSLYWLPQPFKPAATLSNVESALDIQLRPEIHAFYTSQYAGDMQATFDGNPLTLLQVWSEDDFYRLQENLIGHLVTQRRLKLPPTLFIGTIESEMEMLSLCNLTGEVILEHFGTKKRQTVAKDLASFLQNALPLIV